jgi:peroxiredoxin
MSKQKNQWIGFLLVLMLIGFSPNLANSMSIGSASPSFQLPNLLGQDISLNESKGEKVLFMTFWASWSSPCISQMAELNDVHSAFSSNERVELVTINMGESKKVISKFAQKHSHKFQILLDEAREVSRRYNIVSLPTTFVIDTTGHILDIRNGVATKDYFLQHPILEKIQATPLIETTVYEKPDMKIYINDVLFQSEDLPIIKNGRTLLPLRALSRNLGFLDDAQHIIWDGIHKTVTLIKGDLKIFLRIGSKDIYVNNDVHVIDVEPMIYQDRTYIPVRFVSETLGKKVTWNDFVKTISISDK